MGHTPFNGADGLNIPAHHEAGIAAGRQLRIVHLR
jgi:hypothetical protein